MSGRVTILGAAAELAGAGLFTGKPGRVTCMPRRAEQHGVTFMIAGVAVPATCEHLASVGGARHTVLAGERDGTQARIATTEHILSAVAGLGITDLDIALDGPEVPIFDGSALPFAQALHKAGLRTIDGTARPIVVREPIRVSSPDGSATIVAMPRQRPGCSYTYELDYGPSSPLRAQRASYDTETNSYAAEIAPARTFCLEHEARAMQAAGMFKDLTPRDMLVIGAGGRPIDNELRFENEPARHKVLDMIGDLFLAGAPIQADIVGTRSGHALNHEMARRLRALAR